MYPSSKEEAGPEREDRNQWLAGQSIPQGNAKHDSMDVMARNVVETCDCGSIGENGAGGSQGGIGQQDEQDEQGEQGILKYKIHDFIEVRFIDNLKKRKITEKKYIGQILNNIDGGFYV